MLLAPCISCQAHVISLQPYCVNVQAASTCLVLSSQPQLPRNHANGHCHCRTMCMHQPMLPVMCHGC
jgi:hypothetical protein